MLALITIGPVMQLTFMASKHAQRRKAHPVLLVPGSFSGAWIWADTFQPYFAEAGFDCYAMSFTSHERRGLALHRRGLDSYVGDLEAALDKIAVPPIVVAHSLGGLVAQRLAGGRALPGLILLSAIPPGGVWRSLLHLAKQDLASPLKLLALALYPPVRYLGSPPTGIYSGTPDPRRAHAVLKQLRGESLLALAQSLAGRPPGIGKTPTYCIGMTGDHIIPAAEVARTAIQIGAESRIFEGYSHTPMVEPDWELIARDMVGWIGWTVEARS